jgi:hypothetical protein
MIEKISPDEITENNKLGEVRIGKIALSKEFIDAVAKTYQNMTPESIISKDKNGKVTGLFIGFKIRKNIFFKERFLMSPFVDVSGIYGEPNKELVECLKKRFSNIEIRLSSFGPEQYKIGRFLVKNGFSEHEEKSHYIIILKSEEDFWNGFHKHTRNDIRKAEKSNLKIIPVEDKSELKRMYRLYAREMKNFGTPHHAYSFFYNLMTSFGKNFVAYNCYSGKDLIASSVMLVKESEGYLAFNFSNEKARSLRPNDLLYWTTIKEAIARKITLIDVGQVDTGAKEGTHAAGLFNFKSKWLGNPYKRFYYKYPKQKKTDSRKEGLKKFRNIWKILPMPVVNIAGPFICRRIAI